MKIIRHGYFGEGVFICPACGCVFQLDEPEPEDPTFSELCNLIFPNCPDCGCRSYEQHVTTNKE